MEVFSLSIQLYKIHHNIEPLPLCLVLTSVINQHPYIKVFAKHCTLLS